MGVSKCIFSKFSSFLEEYNFLANIFGEYVALIIHFTWKDTITTECKISLIPLRCVPTITYFTVIFDASALLFAKFLIFLSPCMPLKIIDTGDNPSTEKFERWWWEKVSLIIIAFIDVFRYKSLGILDFFFL